MNKKKDVREGCAQCNTLYGLENPRMNSLRNSRNYIALTKDNPRKPSLIMIVPRAHKRKVSDIMNNKTSADEAQNFVAQVLSHCENRLKCGWKAFQVIWKDGRESITVSQTYTHLKTHAHAEIHIIY